MSDDPCRRIQHVDTCVCDDCLAEAYGYDWRQLVPGTGWLYDWVAYGLACTDAPPLFHIASGLAALATVVGSNCVFQPSPNDTPYLLNLWILTAGSSAKERKSTSVVMADDLLTANFTHLKAAWSGSPEALFSMFVTQPQCILIIPEFPSFLAQMAQKYAQPTKTLLMDLFDGKTKRRTTRGKGDEVIEQPRISLIGAGALDLLDKNLQDVDFRSGFLSRMFFVAGDRQKRLRRAKQYPGTLQTLQRGLLEISRWARNLGTITASRPADDALDALCIDIDAQTRAADPAYQSLIARNELHAHKIAALFAASMRNPCVYDSLVRQRVEPLIALSIGVVQRYLINMMSQSEFVRAAHRVRAYIQENALPVGHVLTYREIVQISQDVKHANLALEQLLAEDVLAVEYQRDPADATGDPSTRAAMRKCFRIQIPG